MNRRSDPGPVDLQVSASPREIRERVLARLLPVRSLWFASAADQRAWSQAGLPLYVLRESEEPARRLEVGPRLTSLWASCFAPALVGELEPDGANTRVRWRIRWPQPTRILVVSWWLVLVLWAIAIVTGRTDEGQPAVFWVFLLLMSTVGPALGWHLGGQALAQAWPTLRQAIEQPEVGEDW